MFDKVLLAVLLSAMLFVVYLVFTKQLKIESFEVPAPAPPVYLDPPADSPRTITPGGPNTPNQQAPPDPPVVERLPGPADSDPYDESYGSSNIKDNLRHPERFFGPAPQPTNTQIALESGVAGIENSKPAIALQTFSPEMAQNGGQFMEGGIFASDAFENPTYSSF
jgi:hypothetical protein